MYLYNVLYIFPEHGKFLKQDINKKKWKNENEFQSTIMHYVVIAV